MKGFLSVFAALFFTLASFGQIAYLQYRVVPIDRQQEFIEKETKYWSKVAKAAIDKGQMSGWSLWRKIGVTEQGAPNYVFVNTFESIDKIDQEAVWSEGNMSAMGVSPSVVETNSFAPTAFDYWMQVEDVVQGDYKYALVNYAMPSNLGAFIEDNKTVWKPFHDKNVQAGNMGMTSWGMMSVISPKGNLARFSVLTWDGFNKLSDVWNYMRYQPDATAGDAWADVLSKTKMNEILPDGFQYSIIYERVMSLGSTPPK